MMRANGFTLVETLVALFVFALLAAGGAFILGNSVDAAARIDDVSDEVQALQRTRAALMADVGQMTLRERRDDVGTAQPALRAASNELMTFARHGPDNPDGEARPSLSIVTWRQGADGLERLAARQVDGVAPASPALLLPGARNAELYFRYDGAWSETPLAEPSAPMPDAVRLTLDHPRFGAVEQIFLVGSAT